jgi:hypothetical protein
MRYLRATAASLLLILLVAGFPVLLAQTIGNPLTGWPALHAGDVSDEVFLDVLAAFTWAAWASFAWSVLSEIIALAARVPRPHLPGTLPGPQHLAHTLVTAAFLVLPSNPLLTASATAHPGAVAALAPRAPTTGHAVPPETRSAAINATATEQVSPVPSSPAHRAHDSAAASSTSPTGFVLGTGVGLVTGVTLRELGRLRRRQWRHRHPGRVVPATPAHLVAAEKALTLPGPPISDTDRAQILAAHASTQDQPMPPARGQQPWDSFCDAAGAPLPQLTSPTTDITADTDHRSDQRGKSNSCLDGPQTEPGVSLLTQPLDTLLATTATTAPDAHTLAPPVHTRVRTLIQHADPDLDEDLAAWRAPDTHRPRLSVLGPIQVRARGHLPSPRPRLAWHTEVVAYLGAHPRGVTPEKFGSDLWPGEPDIAGKPKVRAAMHNVRDWLGTDPTTGQGYVPQVKSNTAGPASLYRAEGLLCDADLFRRLRLRGVTRGPQGIHDLETALHLVTGPPYDPSQRRNRGYRWLIDTPVDTETTAMIIDVAHLVATHHLSTNRPDLAARAAHTSLATGTHDDIPLLDLVAACDAQGHHAEAATWIQRILATHNAEVEEDLPPRTADILHRRRRLYHTI